MHALHHPHGPNENLANKIANFASVRLKTGTAKADNDSRSQYA